MKGSSCKSLHRPKSKRTNVPREPEHLFKEAKLMVEQTTRYGFGTTVNMSYQRALERTREELGKEGFGVLTEIDVAATLKGKLDVSFRPYVILGACNPALAYRALSAERDIGLLLPCNIVVYAADQPGQSVVAAMDPIAALALTGNEQVRGVAAEVRTRLERVLAAVGG
jgi:uncharacterized protein (DUF302 family)